MLGAIHPYVRKIFMLFPFLMKPKSNDFLFLFSYSYIEKQITLNLNPPICV